MREEVIQSILENKIIAIMRGASVEEALSCARAAFDGGIRLMEVTFNQRSPETFSDTAEAIRRIKELCPEMHVGAGTVLTVQQAELARSAGAEYILSPDVDREVIEYTRGAGLVSIPGAYTPSEIKRAYVYGADFVKVFPCTDVSYLKMIKAPLSHIRMLAVGGVTSENAPDFIRAGAVGIAIGGALFSKADIEEGRYDRVEEKARTLIRRVGEAI